MKIFPEKVSRKMFGEERRIEDNNLFTDSGGDQIMRDTASTFKLSSLCRMAALAAAAVTLMFVAGCGHHCCNKCNSCNKCNTCNTCSTCGVSEAAPAPCATCSACAAANGSYDRVGQAPQSLSEPTAPQYAPQYSQPVPQSNVYQNSAPPVGSNTSFDRVGQSHDLPVFGAAPASMTAPASSTFVPAPVPNVTPATQPAAPATLLPTAQPRSNSNGGGQYHTLEKGETVYGLSRKFGVAPKTILAANHFSDPNRLAVGTKIYIPN